ncbi:MAG: extracellular solute-binding protein [Candidatus Magasanikbacteria bacterium]|nr:extracellular solute-binding protein [Candidatus Magasanikbacteria bacterium]
MKLKHIISFSTLAVLLLTAGFGCKGISTAQQQATTPVTLEYWTVFDDVDAIQKEIQSYRALRPYINVNIRQLRAEELYPRLIEALAEDHGPDIISIQNRDLGKFLSKLTPMPSSVPDATVIVEQGKFSQTVTVNTLTQPLVTPTQLDNEYIKVVKDDVLIGGKIYGLPLSVDMMAVYYNKDLLDRAGIAQPPANWDDFQQDVKKITKYDKKTGKILQSGAAFGTGENVPGSDDLLYVLYQQSNLNFVGGGGQAQFNQGGASFDVMNFYTDYANPARDTYTWSADQGDALDAFVNGKVGFFFGYSYHFPVIKSRAPQLDFRVLPLFQLSADKPVNVANYWLQTVTAKSKHQNEAWGLINFLTHTKATKDYLDQTDRPTALRAYITDQKTKPELQPFMDQILIAKNWYHGHDYAAAVKAVNDMIAQWLQPITDGSKAQEIQTNILNQGMSKVNQTL